jgi:hypothetical protein
MAGPWTAGLPMTNYPPATLGAAYPIIQYGSFSMASSATSQVSTIVASSSGYHVVILAGQLSVSSSASVNFQSHTTSAQATAVSLMSSAASLNTMNFSFTPYGFFSSAINEGMDILAIGSQVNGFITFIYF